MSAGKIKKTKKNKMVEPLRKIMILPKSLKYTYKRLHFLTKLEPEEILKHFLIDVSIR